MQRDGSDQRVPVVIADPGPLARYSKTTLFVLCIIAAELALILAKL